MELLLSLVTFIIGILVCVAFFSFRKKHEDKRLLASLTEAQQRAYRVEVLRELEERIGYSLDIGKIIEIITGSLGELLEYSTVSSMIKVKDRIIFKSILREGVNRSFVEETKHKMLGEFSSMLEHDLHKDEIEESITGTVFTEGVEPLVSYYSVPVRINKKIVGLISVASTKSGIYTEKTTGTLSNIITQVSSEVTQFAEVLESEKGKLNSLVASLNDGVVMFDPSWNLLVINPEARKLLGLPLREVTALDVLDKLSGKVDIRTKIEEAIQKSVMISVPNVVLDTITLQLFAIPVKGKDEELLGSVVVFHDITKERELQTLREQFEAMVVHDLRSPLTSIRVTSENLLRFAKTMKPEEQSASLATIQSQTQDMMKLVNGLLDAAKLESGKFTVVKAPCDIGALIKEIITRSTPVAKEKNIEIISEIHGQMGGIPLDDYRIKQVLTNLVSNAIRYSEKGPITVHAKRDEKDVTISVSDNGIGIPKDQIGKLFTKYYTLQQGGSYAGGNGLGLVVSKGIIEAHGGKMWVESEEGIGSTFIFTLPLK